MVRSERTIDECADAQERSPQLRAFVKESNRIEGILRPPLRREIAAHERFLALSGHIEVGEIASFVLAVANRFIRDQPGMDVRVGNHIAPRGGPEIPRRLASLLDQINVGLLTAWEAHQAYETLHPFMDGNGRSGRVLWLWQMLRDGRDPYALKRGFLHTFYYQTLGAARAEGPASPHGNSGKPQ